MSKVFVVLFLACLAGMPAFAQDAATPRDSLRSYDLAEIVVRTADAAPVEPSATLQKVSLGALARQDALGVSDVLRLVPAAHVQTNSRGETLVYLRNAGERQVALFFDGALLNTPWDNRIDLSLVPTAALGGITVVKGVPSVLYGANVVGGVINLTSRTLGDPGRLTEISLQGGAPRSHQAAASHFYRGERWSAAGAVGYAARSGDPLPSGADLPFSQSDASMRTNTDRRVLSAFGSATYRSGSALRLGVSVLHLDGEKGVAPEGHLDPSTRRVRFWRYPVWRNTMLVVHGDAALGGGVRLRGATWGSRFDQTIDQYASDAYDRVERREEGRDYVAGTRLVLARRTGPGDLRLALNALTATHAQHEHDPDRPGAAPTLSYRQHTLSAGAEYEWRATPALGLVAGASLDAMATPETGDKPGRDPFVDYGVTTGLTYTLGPGLVARAAAGRKVRFPTMRELFGEALDRFRLNPDLGPETAVLSEVGLEAASARLSGEIVAFVGRTYDTIDQETLPDGRRRRINLDGGRVVGLEAGGIYQPLPRLTLNGHLTWTHARGFRDGIARPLPEKPEWLGTLSAAFNTRGGFSFLLQPVFTGRSFSMDADGTFRRLPAALVVNARLSFRFFRAARPSFFSEWFLRVDNVADAAVLPQLGLPAPGREIRAGLNLTL